MFRDIEDEEDVESVISGYKYTRVLVMHRRK